MQREQYRIDARNNLQLDSLDYDENLGHPVATRKDGEKLISYEQSTILSVLFVEFSIQEDRLWLHLSVVY